MAFQRGDLVLVPFPFPDQTGLKVRPAVVLCGEEYQRLRPDIIFGAVTSQIASVGPLDHLLLDWAQAGLKLPSAFRPVLATIAASRVVHRIGRCSERDALAIDRSVARSLS